MKTTKIASYAEQTLNANYRTYVESNKTDGENYYLPSISEWAELESESDPDFFRWILNNSDVSDFGSNLSDEDMEFVKNYINSL